MGIYLDHNATTPVDPEVLEEMLPYLRGSFGNPSSVHAFGQRARYGMDLARQRVAALIGAQPHEIVFTSGGTESNNYALFGAWEANQHRGKQVLSTAIEHQAVLYPLAALKKRRAKVKLVGVDHHGLIDLKEINRQITDKTVLVSIMAANNDVGTIQPIPRVARLTQKRGALLHTDAAQAVGKIPINVRELGADLMSFSAHKLYGPKGIGALYIRHGVRIAPLICGGHHELRRRAGTENVPAIVGFGMACALANKRMRDDAAKTAKLRDRLQQAILKGIPDVHVNGHPAWRLPNTVNVSFDGVDGEALLMSLDLKGVAASASSACTSDARDPSHVLTAMGFPAERSTSSVRFSLGRYNNEGDIDTTVEIVVEVVKRLRSS